MPYIFEPLYNFCIFIFFYMSNMYISLLSSENGQAHIEVYVKMPLNLAASFAFQQ